MDKIDAVEIEEFAEPTRMPVVPSEDILQPCGKVAAYLRLPVRRANGTKFVIAVCVEDRGSAYREFTVKEAQAFIEAFEFHVEGRALGVTSTTWYLMTRETIETGPIAYADNRVGIHLGTKPPHP